jgi:hypothetical protein
MDRDSDDMEDDDDLSTEYNNYIKRMSSGRN